MNLLPSDDLSIGDFVGAFPGSAQQVGCSSCGTWEFRQRWSEERMADAAAVAFLSEPMGGEGRRVVGAGASRGEQTGPGGGWGGSRVDRGEPEGGGWEARIDWEGEGPDLPRPDPGPSWHRGPLEYYGGGGVGVDDLIDILAGGALCDKIELPPFWAVRSYTRECFLDEKHGHIWPASDCEAPCLRVNAGLPVATVDQKNDALLGTYILFPEYGSRVLRPYDELKGYGFTNWVLEYQHQDGLLVVDFIVTALVMLQQNIDLVEWVTCLAFTWAPQVSDDKAVIDNRVNDVLARIRGGRGVEIDGRQTGFYVVNRSLADGSTAWVNLPEYGDDDSLVGVVLAMGKSELHNTMMGAFLDGGVRGACAVLALAEIILHELCHEASRSEVDLPLPDHLFEADDHRQCWAVQNMAGISFMWAMGQRYPQLQSATCCPKTADEYFMTSEPDATRQIEYQDPGFPRGVKEVPIHYEVPPWGWTDGVPC